MLLIELSARIKDNLGSMEKVSYHCASHAPALIITNHHIKRHEKSVHLPSNRVIEVL